MDKIRGGGGSSRSDTEATRLLHTLASDLQSAKLRREEYYISDLAAENPDLMFLPERACYYMMDKEKSGLLHEPDIECQRVSNYLPGLVPRETVAESRERLSRERQQRADEAAVAAAARQHNPGVEAGSRRVLLSDSEEEEGAADVEPPLVEEGEVAVEEAEQEQPHSSPSTVVSIPQVSHSAIDRIT
jgi:hypothetical protein